MKSPRLSNSRAGLRPLRRRARRPDEGIRDVQVEQKNSSMGCRGSGRRFIFKRSNSPPLRLRRHFLKRVDRNRFEDDFTAPLSFAMHVIARTSKAASTLVLNRSQNRDSGQRSYARPTRPRPTRAIHFSSLWNVRLELATPYREMEVARLTYAAAAVHKVSEYLIINSLPRGDLVHVEGP
jgi:hypothetical protein